MLLRGCWFSLSCFIPQGKNQGSRLPTEGVAKFLHIVVLKIACDYGNAFLEPSGDVILSRVLDLLNRREPKRGELVNCKGPNLINASTGEL
jgi:hypothetical protein